MWLLAFSAKSFSVFYGDAVESMVECSSPGRPALACTCLAVGPAIYPYAVVIKRKVLEVFVLFVLFVVFVWVFFWFLGKMTA